MRLRSILSRRDLSLQSTGSTLSACLIAGLLSVTSAPAVENELLQTAGPVASAPVGFTLMPKPAQGPGALLAQAAMVSPAPGTPAMIRVVANGAAVSLSPFLLNPAPADTKLSAALLLVNGSPTAVMAEDEAQATTNQIDTIRPADIKESTQVNILTGLGTASGQDYLPLTREQRWKYYLNQNFTSWGAVVGPSLTSLIDQAGGQPPEWGGGMQGYGKRLVSRLGTGMIMSSVQSAGCALLGQEPRYINSTSTNVFARIGHGFLYSLITYNNEGKKRFALATLASYYAASMTTTLWMPAHSTALGDGVRDGNRQVILAGFINQWQEFWPEIRRYILRRS